jgi:serine/threonine-protein kinase
MGSSTIANAATQQLVFEQPQSTESTQAALNHSALRPVLFASSARGWRVSGEDPLIGRIFDGGYHIGALLARSGMSRIYRGHNTATGAPCVLKFARDPEDPKARLWIRREAYLTQQVSHPNVVRLLHQGELAGFGPYLALEYLGGANLAALTSQGPLPITPAVYIAAQIASALYAVHQLGIEHRDVKPANIILCGGERQLPAAKLIDFGVSDYSSDGVSEAAVPYYGTPQYVAPERIKGERTGPFSDQYSLGCVLYEMLTGQVPYPGKSIVSMLQGHLRGCPTPPRERRYRQRDSAEAP